MLPGGVRVANGGVGLFSERGDRGNKPPFPSSARAAESEGSLRHCCRKDQFLGWFLCARGVRFCTCLYHLIAPMLCLF